jgi:hypothetical protein
VHRDTQEYANGVNDFVSTQIAAGAYVLCGWDVNAEEEEKEVEDLVVTWRLTAAASAATARALIFNVIHTFSGIVI